MGKGGTNNNKQANNSCNYVTSTSGFFSIPPIQFTLLSTLVGILLIDNLDLNEQNSLGNFIVGVGQTILTAAAQGELIKTGIENADNNNINQDDDIHEQIKMLKKQIDGLEKKLN